MERCTKCINGNFPFRRYRDKEQSDSPVNVVTSAPTFKSDDVNKSISVKTSVKPLSAATSATRAAKKIDMGAALNYGKASDLGINSPTHRNTHNENLFGDEPVVFKASASKGNNDIIEDIFSSAASSDPIDDFNPRAGEPAAPDFGDFTSAFGSTAAPVTVAPVASEFADFSSAFTAQSAAIPTPFTSQPVAPSLFPAAPSPPLDNFLFSATQPAPTQSTNTLIGGADLFGNSVITSAFTSPTTGGNKDLLSDFGDLTLNPIQGENINRGWYLGFFL